MAKPKEQVKIYLGDLVFAKIKGYPPWPASVIEIKPKHMYKVRFFDSGQTSIVKLEDMFPYRDNRERFATDVNMRRKDFRIAMELIAAEYSFDIGLDISDDDSDCYSWDTVSSWKKTEVGTATPTPSLYKEDAAAAEEKPPVPIEDLPSTSACNRKLTEVVSTPVPTRNVEERFILVCKAIRLCLDINKTDVNGCLRMFKQLKELDLTKEMLLRHPDCVHTVHRCRRYIGNMKQWNFNARQEAQFKEMAAMIRAEADMVCKKFQVIFPYLSHGCKSTFLDSFKAFVMDREDPLQDSIMDQTIFPDCADEVDDKEEAVEAPAQPKKRIIKRISDEKYMLLYGFLRY